MSENSRGGRGGRPNRPIQRPLGKYKQQMVAQDAELARKLQEEEGRRSKLFHKDELLARQMSEQINGHQEGASAIPDEEDFHNEFVRYRGMTEVDSLLAKQMQQQEEETANRNAEEMAKLRREEQNLCGQTEDAYHGFPDHMAPRLGHNVVIGRRMSPGGRGYHGPRRRFIQIGPQNRGAEEALPEGEVDPVMLLMQMGGAQGSDFVNIMQDPLLLVMALSRAPGFNGTQENVDLNDYEGLWELAERLGEVQKKGMSRSQIQNLPERTHQAGATAGDQTTDCQVCLTPFEQGETIRTLPCLHEYHSKCVDEWLMRNSTCPICRQDVT